MRECTWSCARSVAAGLVQGLAGQADKQSAAHDRTLSEDPASAARTVTAQDATARPGRQLTASGAGDHGSGVAYLMGNHTTMERMYRRALLAPS
jgi:hypothetical protein